MSAATSLGPGHSVVQVHLAALMLHATLNRASVYQRAKASIADFSFCLTSRTTPNAAHAGSAAVYKRHVYRQDQLRSDLLSNRHDKFAVSNSVPCTFESRETRSIARNKAARHALTQVTSGHPDLQAIGSPALCTWTSSTLGKPTASLLHLGSSYRSAFATTSHDGALCQAATTHRALLIAAKDALATMTFECRQPP